MVDDYDTQTHVEDSKNKAEEVAEEFEGYDNFKDAIDALAQEQIVIGNEKQITSDAEAEAGYDIDEEERAATVRECDVRHEIGQALQKLLESYGYDIRSSFGEDSDARSEE